MLDVYVSQWFGNGDAALEFLKSDATPIDSASRKETQQWY